MKFRSASSFPLTNPYPIALNSHNVALRRDCQFELMFCVLCRTSILIDKNDETTTMTLRGMTKAALKARQTARKQPHGCCVRHMRFYYTCR